MRKLSLLFALLFVVIGYAQELGKFKYVIIPERYENFKKNDQYNLSTLSKYMFSNLGFIVVDEKGELPIELAKDPCLALKPTLEIDSNMFSTKMKIVLKNCFNQTVFVTEEGICRKEKDNRISHQTAFREASKSFSNLNLSDGIVGENSVIENNKVENIETKKLATNTFDQVLYAQPVGEGFQLIDSTPAVIMKLTKTSSPDIFLVDYKGNEGVLLKKSSGWVFEYSVNGVLNSHPLNVKF